MGALMRDDEKQFFCIYEYQHGLEFTLAGIFSRRDDAMAEKATYSSGAITSIMTRTMTQILKELANSCHQDLIERVKKLESEN